jgi:hypothetical protein
VFAEEFGTFRDDHSHSETEQGEMNEI